jgi:hypothetical protein
MRKIFALVLLALALVGGFAAVTPLCGLQHQRRSCHAWHLATSPAKPGKAFWQAGSTRSSGRRMIIGRRQAGRRAGRGNFELVPRCPGYIPPPRAAGEPCSHC